MDDKSHIFICFSSKDEGVARTVVESLEAEGMKCWISSRDVAPGQNYQEVIVHALEAAKGVVFLFSESSRESGEIKKELSLAGSGNVPVFPLRLSAITPSGALRYELATRQWIDLFPAPERSLRTLVETIRTVLNAPPKANEPGTAVVMPASAAAPVPVASRPARKRVQKARAPIVAAGSEQFEALRLLLARHIGPIAKVFIQKAATEARTPEEFCEQLAGHVNAPSDRASFLQAARSQLAIKS